MASFSSIVIVGSEETLYDLKMSAPEDHIDQPKAVPQSTAAPSWPTNASDIRTIKVSNLSLATSEKEVKEFFSFSGDIRHIEMQRENESTQIAYVTFKELQGAETALLLTGSKIVDQSVSITRAEHYQLPQEVLSSNPSTHPEEEKQIDAVKKAEDVASTRLARGYSLGKDAVSRAKSFDHRHQIISSALSRAKSFDQRHQLISNASATVASIDQRMGLSDKLSMGTAIVNEKVREMDERLQVSEKTRSVVAAAGPKAGSAMSAIMTNPYVVTGTSWMSNAFTAVAKAAEDVGTMTKEKVEMAEIEEKDINDDKEKKERISDEVPGSPAVPVSSSDDSKTAIM